MRDRVQRHPVPSLEPRAARTVVMHDLALLALDVYLLPLDASPALARRPQSRARGKDFDGRSLELRVQLRRAAEDAQRLVAICRLIAVVGLARQDIMCDCTEVYPLPFCM